jgi:hypothetical protein
MIPKKGEAKRRNYFLFPTRQSATAVSAESAVVGKEAPPVSCANTLLAQADPLGVFKRLGTEIAPSGISSERGTSQQQTENDYFQKLHE